VSTGGGGERGAVKSPQIPAGVWAAPTQNGSRRARRLGPLVAWLVGGASLLVVGCFGQKPSGEVAPSTAPQAPPPPAPAPTGATSLSPSPEKKEAEPFAQPPPSAAESAGSGAIAPAPARTRPARKAARATAVEAPKAGADSEDSIGLEPSPSEALRKRLDRAYGAQSADCPSARDRKKAVCDLAGQICSLTDRDPNVASVAEYCDDARRRCSEAERRTEERCPS
jgi:hypothetical protein